MIDKKDVKVFHSIFGRKNMKLSELIRRAEIVPISVTGITDPDIVGITEHSSLVRRSYLFAALRGLLRDGNDFVVQAAANGAACILTGERFTGDLGIPIVRVEDPRRALARSAAVLSDIDLAGVKIAAVTGTNGKTTVAGLLGSIFTSFGKKSGIIGTAGVFSGGEPIEISKVGSVTTPDPEVFYPTLRRLLRDGCRFITAEASSHAIALSKLEGITFDVGIFLNLTKDHLDFHGDMEKYFEAKSGICRLCRKTVINVSDSYGQRLSEMTRGAVTFSVGGGNAEAAYRVLKISEKGFDGVSYLLEGEKGAIMVKSPMWGSVTVENTAAAAVAALEMGVDTESIRRGIASYGGPVGRGETVALTDEGIRVIIDYAHTPDALEKLLSTASSYCGGRLITVFGCGGERCFEKRREMGRIAAMYSDVCIVTDDNPRNEDPAVIRKEIVNGAESVATDCEILEIGDRGDGIKSAIMMARASDTVILAGKGHEEYIIDKCGKRFFSERDEVTRAFLEKHRDRSD